MLLIVGTLSVHVSVPAASSSVPVNVPVAVEAFAGTSFDLAPTTLNQRNVYILPTRAGFTLGATLLVLLVSSINYQLNLGYLFTFMLAGSAVIGMHISHATLRGLTMNLIAPEPHFAGAAATIGIKLTSERATIRHGIGLAVLGSDHWSWCSSSWRCDRSWGSPR